jgi:hypothetical protein
MVGGTRSVRQTRSRERGNKMRRKSGRKARRRRERNRCAAMRERGGTG